MGDLPGGFFFALSQNLGVIKCGECTGIHYYRPPYGLPAEALVQTSAGLALVDLFAREGYFVDHIIDAFYKEDAGWDSTLLCGPRNV